MCHMQNERGRNKPVSQSDYLSTDTSWLKPLCAGYREFEHFLLWHPLVEE